MVFSDQRRAQSQGFCHRHVKAVVVVNDCIALGPDDVGVALDPVLSMPPSASDLWNFGDALEDVANAANAAPSESLLNDGLDPTLDDGA